jgi:hypothetical protein
MAICPESKHGDATEELIAERKSIRKESLV